jgi:ketosteroid isomerase-like protein
MDDIYAINLAKSRFREGFNTGDVEMVLSTYADEFSDMSFGMPSFYSSDAKDVFRARLQRLFRDYSADMKISIISVALAGDRAFDWGWHELTLTPRAGGETRRLRTRYFERWRNDTVRGWIITTFIDNPDETPQLPEDLIARIEHDATDGLATRLASDPPRFSSTEPPSGDR